jgi:hypothetical protein
MCCYSYASGNMDPCALYASDDTLRDLTREMVQGFGGGKQRMSVLQLRGGAGMPRLDIGCCWAQCLDLPYCNTHCSAQLDIPGISVWLEY